MNTSIGATPLVLASRGGHVEVAKALLNAGADPLHVVDTYSVG